MAVRHHVKVLIIDDDRDICNNVSTLLQEEGYAPTAFDDPERAAEEALRTSYHVALVDMRMPQASGSDVIRELKQRDESISCIVMTGFPTLDSATEVMRCGACDYLVKPFDRAALISAVEGACRRMGIIYTNECELNKIIGERIRHHRQKQNHTLRQLSARTSLTTSQLSQVELGKNAASLWALARISNGLGLQMSELLKGL